MSRHRLGAVSFSALEEGALTFPACQKALQDILTGLAVLCTGQGKVEIHVSRVYDGDEDGVSEMRVYQIREDTPEEIAAQKAQKVNGLKDFIKHWEKVLVDSRVELEKLTKEEGAK